MTNIDKFVALNIAVLTVSDTRSSNDDTSGDALDDLLTKSGHICSMRALVSDDETEIVTVLRRWISDPAIDVIISTGGTGVTGRDVTPEAFQQVFEKEIPGFGELFRTLSYQIIGASTIQSRAIAGLAGGTYLFALPGSPSACKDAWTLILGPQLDARTKPCNFVQLMPRLNERDRRATKPIS